MMQGGALRPRQWVIDERLESWQAARGFGMPGRNRDSTVVY
jgi:hypothetical protein